MKILLICINYKSDKETLLFVEEVLTLPCDCDMDLVVVDNNCAVSSDVLETSLNAVGHKHGKNLLYFKTSQNLGYFGGARHGLSRYLSAHSMPEWVIVSNVDIKFISKDFMHQLANRNDTNDAVGVVAPSIISGVDGRDQNPLMLRRPHRSRMAFYTCIYRSVILVNLYEILSLVKKSLIGRWRGASTTPSEFKTIYAPHGSFMIFSRQYFERAGSLDFPCFLFGEEIFVAETARSIGLDVVYEPSLQLLHDEHLVTRRFWSRQKVRYQHESIKYLMDAFFTRSSDADKKRKRREA